MQIFTVFHLQFQNLAPFYITFWKALLTSEVKVTGLIIKESPLNLSSLYTYEYNHLSTA